MCGVPVFFQANKVLHEVRVFSLNKSKASQGCLPAEQMEKYRCVNIYLT